MGFKKGKQFERETAAIAGKYGMVIPMSGAIGTVTGISDLAGDVRWKFPWFNSNINVECKHGYDRSKTDQKTMTVYRNWFDKHLKQAKLLNFYPVFAFKFKFTQQNGMSKFVLIPFPIMEKLIHQTENVYLEMLELREENEKLKKLVADVENN